MITRACIGYGLIAIGLGWLTGCGGGYPGASSGGTGGISPNNTATAGAGGQASSSAGSGGAAGQSGMPSDPGLDCARPNGDFKTGMPIACNGACLQDPGDQSAGCRIVLRSFNQKQLVVDANAIFVTDQSIVGRDVLGFEASGPLRIAAVDRATAKVVGEVMSHDPEVRAVSPSQIAWIEG